MGAMPNDANHQAPADIRLVLPPALADAVRESAAKNRRTLSQEILYQLEQIFSDERIRM